MKLIPKMATAVMTVPNTAHVIRSKTARAVAVNLVQRTRGYAVSITEEGRVLRASGVAKAISVNSEIASSFEKPSSNLVWS